MGQTVAPTCLRVTAADTREVLEVGPAGPPVDSIVDIGVVGTGTPAVLVVRGDIAILAGQVRAGLATDVRAPNAHPATRRSLVMAVTPNADANVVFRETPTLAEVRTPVNVRQAPDVAYHALRAVLVSP